MSAMKKKLPNSLLIPEVAELIRGGHSVTLTARGNSMNPFIVDYRDRLVLSPCSEDQLHPGAVVLAETDNNRYVLHRILYRQGDKLTLLGDGNFNQTEQTDTKHVIGILTAVIRKGRTFYTDSYIWIFYSRWWMELRPVRRILLAIYRRM